MAAILRLAAMLAGLSLRRAGARAAGVTATFAAALLFLLVGLLGLSAAGFILLAQATSPLVSALVCGGAGLVIGAGLLLAARAQARPARLFLGQGTGLPADLSALMKDASDSQLRGALAVTAVAAFLLASRR